MTEKEFKEKLIIELESGKYKQTDKIYSYHGCESILSLIDRKVGFYLPDHTNHKLKDTIEKLFHNEIPFSICAILLENLNDES